MDFDPPQSREETAMPAVLTERQGALATITLNRPERRNGVTLGLCLGLYQALIEIAASDARVLILRGAGNDFCVGADMAGASADEAVARPSGFNDQGPIYEASLLLHTMPQVTIAAIDGGCAGAGMGWAAACDFRFGSAEARFSTAFLTVAASGDMGLIWSLNRILCGAKARELLFFPEKLTGEQALALGLITRLFPRASLHDEVARLARQLCDRDDLALGMMKANIVSAETLPLADYIAIETARHLRCAGRPDFAKRMAQLFEKSKAQ
jgi:2-(1,2-epoxy-1,2-dihydrophenyl)acetyl-CoA isomerase